MINGWLIEMAVGEIPTFGLLHDPALKGESAESIYNRIATDLRAARKLCTLRGIGRGDILEPADAAWQRQEEGLELDEFAAGRWRMAWPSTTTKTVDICPRI